MVNLTFGLLLAEPKKGQQQDLDVLSMTPLLNFTPCNHLLSVGKNGASKYLIACFHYDAVI